ncbi:MAG TPA: sodium:proton antiporter [bacterium]|nr:MAG: Citrate transporter [bacterium ADurb.Bin236]HPI75361.1 sodium:proton antiporter [bacterium]HPN93299.1 sodium:proton antiporter [bacterium]
MSNRILLKTAAIIPIIFLFSILFNATVPTERTTIGKLLTITASASEHAAEAAPAGEHASEAAAHEGEEAHEEGSHGPINMSILWIIPFAGILLSIAIIPLINGHWWHHNFPKVSMLFGIPMTVAMFLVLQTKTIHTFVEYCSFIALVGSLFVISGGILIRGSFKSSPMTNTVFLIIGSIIASFIGTAGASMVLIRPMLRINKNRKTKLHIFIFFIFAVSNIGGSLTPLGDPPLFLGFLQGVPFEWTLIHMLPGWAFAIGILMVLFYAIDSMMVKKDGGIPADDPNEPKQKFSILGSYNFLFLLGVMGTVVFYGTVLRNMEQLGFIKDAIQIGLMALMAALSLIATPKPIREENGFSWFPVKEVAILFAAIFACMIPALNILEYKGQTGALTLTHAWQYFWMAGGLSSFLDNAPTYLTFLSLGKTIGGAGCVAVYGGCVPQHILLAIAMGAVFFGAMSYIGNAPNFMVKSICEENKVPMPSFLGYMVWSIGILGPLFLLATFVFHRG